MKVTKKVDWKKRKSDAAFYFQSFSIFVRLSCKWIFLYKKTDAKIQIQRNETHTTDLLILFNKSNSIFYTKKMIRWINAENISHRHKKGMEICDLNFFTCLCFVNFPYFMICLKEKRKIIHGIQFKFLHSMQISSEDVFIWNNFCYF